MDNGSGAPIFFAVDNEHRTRQYVHYAAPSLVLQIPAGAKLLLSAALSCGVMLYRAEDQVLSAGLLNASTYSTYAENLLMSGTYVGAGINLTFEYRMLPWLSAGVLCGGFWSSLTKVDVEARTSNGASQSIADQKLPVSIELMRADAAVVLRATF